MSSAPSAVGADRFVQQVTPQMASSAKPQTAFLWEVPGSYEGRLLSVTYELNYAAARSNDKQSFVQVVAQNGDLLNEWLAPPLDFIVAGDTFDVHQVSLALAEGDSVLALPDVAITGPRAFGGMPDIWWPEHTTFTLVFDTDNNNDFLSSVMTLVEGQLATGGTDVVPPYTTESFDLQRDQAATVAA